MKKKERVDVLLVERGLAPTRARAQALLVAGKVFSGEVRVDKPGTTLPLEAPLEVRGDDNPFVSRGGLKLRGALASFAPLGLSVAGKIAVDVGASTGGFTELLLARGAAKVYAVDSGTDQLHAKLRNDPRIVSLEQTDIRKLEEAAMPDDAALIVIDVSFISLEHVLPQALNFAAPHAELIALIKPQFEAGREHLKKGIVRDPEVHMAVCQRVELLVGRQGWRLRGTIASPILGGDGNAEFLLYAEH